LAVVGLTVSAVVAGVGAIGSTRRSTVPVRQLQVQGGGLLGKGKGYGAMEMGKKGVDCLDRGEFS